MPSRFTITSPEFTDGETVPTRFSGDGEDLSPALAWRGVPEGTKELAIICTDPDAPSPKPWVHWLIYKIAPHERELPEGVPPQAVLDAPVTAFQGKNSWSKGRTIGYRGPAPPPGHGLHHYHFRIYALDTQLDVEPGMGIDELMAAMNGHILSDAEIVGTYARPGS